MLASIDTVSLSPWGRRKAFTLVELVVVLLIIAIGSAVAGPAYSRALQTHRVEQAALRVMADLRLAKRHAQLTSASIYVDFDLATHTITIRGIDDFEKFGQPNSISLSSDPYRTQIVELDFNGLQTVEFNGFGTAETLGSLRLQSGVAQKTVVINSESSESH